MVENDENDENDENELMTRSFRRLKGQVSKRHQLLQDRRLIKWWLLDETSASQNCLEPVRRSNSFCLGRLKYHYGSNLLQDSNCNQIIPNGTFQSRYRSIVLD